jgi:hypothetical protein
MFQRGIRDKLHIMYPYQSMLIPVEVKSGISEKLKDYLDCFYN